MNTEQRLRNLRVPSDELLGPAELPAPDLWKSRCPIAQRDKKACNTCDFAIKDIYGRPTDCSPTIKKWWRKKQSGHHPLKRDRQHEEGIL